jgi:hypothetical protein
MTESSEFVFEVVSRPKHVMYMILFAELAEEAVLAILDDVGVPGFTELSKVIGRGPRGHHFDTHVWPGSSRMVYCVVNPEQSETLWRALSAYSASLEQTSNGQQGLHVFTWDCEQRL